VGETDEEVTIFRPRARGLVILGSFAWLLVCGFLTARLVVTIDPIEKPITILGAVGLILLVAFGAMQLLTALFSGVEISTGGLRTINCLGQTGDQVSWNDIQDIQRLGRSFVIESTEGKVRLNSGHYESGLSKALLERLASKEE
jgi:hypothetical protein